MTFCRGIAPIKSRRIQIGFIATAMSQAVCVFLLCSAAWSGDLRELGRAQLDATQVSVDQTLDRDISANPSLEQFSRSEKASFDSPALISRLDLSDSQHVKIRQAVLASKQITDAINGQLRQLNSQPLDGLTELEINSRNTMVEQLELQHALVMETLAMKVLPILNQSQQAVLLEEPIAAASLSKIANTVSQQRRL